jgi:signal peptidase
MSTHQAAARRKPPRRLRATLIALLFVGVAATALLTLTHGHRIYVVHTGSMEPTYMPGDVVIDGPAPKTLHRGEPITFRHSDLTTDVVTHRVADVLPNGLIETKGDANATKDAWQIRPDQVQGSVVGKVSKLGYFIVFLRQPAGIASLATGVLGIVLLWGLFFPAEAEPERQSVPGPRHRRIGTPLAAALSRS